MTQHIALTDANRVLERPVQLECPPPAEEREIRYRCYTEIQRLSRREELQ